MLMSGRVGYGRASVDSGRRGTSVVDGSRGRVDESANDVAAWRTRRRAIVEAAVRVSVMTAAARAHIARVLAQTLAVQIELLQQVHVALQRRYVVVRTHVAREQETWWWTNVANKVRQVVCLDERVAILRPVLFEREKKRGNFSLINSLE